MNLGKAMAIARINVVRLLRDRSGLFFIFVFPLMLVLVLGLSFGGAFAPRVGVAGDDPGTKMQKAEELETEILDEAGLKKLVGS